MQVKKTAEEIVITEIAQIDEDSRSYKYTAILGELQSKLDLYLAAGDYNTEFEEYFSVINKSIYLKTFHKELLPFPQNRVAPSDKRISAAFNFHYYQSPSFKQAYLSYVTRCLNKSRQVSSPAMVPTPL